MLNIVSIFEATIRILHIIQRLSRGGAARSLMATSKYSSRMGDCRHRVVSLAAAEPAALKMAEDAGVVALETPDATLLRQEMEAADVVQVEFWNSPEVYAWLRQDHPAMRLILRAHVAGHKPPQVLTRALMEYSDHVVVASPFTMELPALQNLRTGRKAETVDLVYPAADFERLEGIELRPHSGFNVGYIGTVDFLKMHPNFIAMSSRVNVPEARFMVYGGGAGFAVLRQQAERQRVADRFEFKGYIENIRTALESLDVFGYPLCEDNYSATDVVLEEVMFAGVPPIVFPYGGAYRQVIHNRTGLIVHSEEEYAQAIEFLYHHPEERLRLSRNAREFARRNWGGELAAKQFIEIYKRLASEPKRTRRWTEGTVRMKLGFRGSLDELAAAAKGAVAFIETLGDTAPQFGISLISQDWDALFETEETIAHSSPVLIGAGGGGIFHYRSYYPQDPFLRLWTGLVLQNQNRDALAVAEFTAARRFGLAHWRVSWYLAQSALRLGEKEMAAQSLRKVLEEAPSFEEAQRLLKQLDAI